MGTPARGTTTDDDISNLSSVRARTADRSWDNAYQALVFLGGGAGFVGNLSLVAGRWSADTGSRQASVPTVLGDSFPHILQAARVGSEWAWVSIYQDLAPSVLGYLRARGAGEPEDLTGEVFLQVVRDLPSFGGGEGAFRAWVFAIAYNRLVDERRRRARRPVDPTPDVPVGERASPDAAEEALEEVATERVHRILARLSPDQSAVLLLRVLGQLTVEEVAHVMEKSPGAIKALQRRGLRAVERALAEEGVPL